MSRMRIPNRTFYLFLSLSTLFLMLVGCKSEYQQGPLPTSKHEISLIKELEIKKSIYPIEVEKGTFNMISGWIENDLLLYITDVSDGANVYSHNILNGKKELLFETKDPVISVNISPSKEYILIHSSPSTNEALLTVLNKQGKVVIEERIPSSELNMEWNPFDETEILISAFTEDWDFTVWQWSVDDSTLKEVMLPQPFGYWSGHDSLLYLDWDLEAPSLFADLKRFNIPNQQSEPLMSEILQVDAFGEIMLTISVDENNQEHAVYTFLKNTTEKVATFTTPQLSRYSDWLVPYYDYNPNTGTFLSYQPLYHTKADVYQEGFQLVSYDLKGESEMVILEDMKNEPLSCSPDGKRCLTGYFLENLINLDNQELVSLVPEN